MFGNMTIYTVHVKPDMPATQQRPIFVREGMNYYAFFFPFFWSLYKRLWLQALFFFAMNFLIIVFSEYKLISQGGLMVIGVSMNVFACLSGNDWIRGRLTRDRYVMADITVADSLLRAQQRYFDRFLAA